MARYIDIEAEDFDLMDIDYLRLEDGSDGYDIYVYRDDVEDYLKNRPTADVVEREKIDKAIEEIMEYVKYCDENLQAPLISRAIYILKRNIGE